MSKSKVHMPKELKKKCQVAIHSATAAAAAAGAIPIPMSDAIPITAAQIGMVVALGRAFDITLSESAAKSIIGVGITQQAGRAIASNILKAIPGVGTIAGGFVGASTAAALTEALGWVIADDFYRISKGEDPENIVENVNQLKDAFEGKGYSLKKWEK
ncbi:MAG: GTP-binding protein [Lachnospiraceae bacterium]|nr:GTP-binding protein [Lachnospiraceae bacterium]